MRRGRVPSEVLGECFAWLPFRDRVQTTAVCRGWRSVALGGPLLWATSTVDHVSGLEWALRHSRSAPLRLWILFQDPAIEDMIRPHASRVILIECRAECSASLLKVFAQASSKKLRSLEFRHPRGPEPVWMNLPDDLPQISTLKKLTLVGYEAVLNGNSSIVMGSITDLELDINSWFGPCRLFELVPNVARLILRFWEQDVPLGPKPRSLKEFYITIEDDWSDYYETVDSWSVRDSLEKASFAKAEEYEQLFSFAERICSDGWIMSTIDRASEPSIFEITGLSLSAHPTVFIGDADGTSYYGPAISKFRDSVASLELNVETLVYFLSTGAMFPRATALKVGLLELKTLQTRMEVKKKPRNYDPASAQDLSS